MGICLRSMKINISYIFLKNFKMIQKGVSRDQYLQSISPAGDVGEGDSKAENGIPTVSIPFYAVSTKATLGGLIWGLKHFEMNCHTNLIVPVGPVGISHFPSLTLQLN
jgi:hypothetical protein